MGIILPLLFLFVQSTIIPCDKITTESGFNYDITRLVKHPDIVYQIPGSDLFSFAFCRNLHHSACPTNTPVCIEQPQPRGPTHFVTSGILEDFVITEDLIIPGLGFSLTYFNGDECPNSKDTRKFTVTLECDFDFTAKVETLEEHCHSIVNIRSKFACPVVEKKDMTSSCQLIKRQDQCTSNCECGWCSSGKGCIARNETCYTSLITDKTCEINNNQDNEESEEETIFIVSFLIMIFGLLIIFVTLCGCVTCIGCCALKYCRKSEYSKVSMTEGETPGGPSENVDFILIDFDQNNNNNNSKNQTIVNEDNNNINQPSAPQIPNINNQVHQPNLYPVLVNGSFNLVNQA